MRVLVLGIALAALCLAFLAGQSTYIARDLVPPVMG